MDKRDALKMAELWIAAHNHVENKCEDCIVGASEYGESRKWTLIPESLELSSVKNKFNYCPICGRKL